MKLPYQDIANRYALELPNLPAAFEAAASVPLHARAEWAQQQRSTIYRDGWFANTPVGARGDGETVQQHVEHLNHLIDSHFPASIRHQAKAYADCMTIRKWLPTQ